MRPVIGGTKSIVASGSIRHWTFTVPSVPARMMVKVAKPAGSLTDCDSFMVT